MYKIFINNNSLFISDSIIEDASNMIYQSSKTINTAVNLLLNSEESFINIYSENINSLWKIFTNNFKNIVAAGGIVSNEKDEILFIKRNNVWDLPKGKVENYEKIREAAIREVEEECSISNLILEDFSYITYHIYPLNDEYILKTTNWFSMKCYDNNTPKPQKEEGITEVVWKNKTEIPELSKNTYKNIIELLEIYKNKYLS